MPRAVARPRTVSSARPRGLRPEPLSPTTFFSLGSHSITKQSPPMPQEIGSPKPSTALAAMAASTAEPPAFSISMAARVASGWAVAAAPCRPQAAERLAKVAPSMRSPEPTSGRLRLELSARLELNAGLAKAAAGRVARKVRRRMGGAPWGVRPR